jgi:hypothetical protein
MYYGACNPNYLQFVFIKSLLETVPGFQLKDLLRKSAKV